MSQNEPYDRWRIRITGATTHEWDFYDGSQWKKIDTTPVRLDKGSTEGYILLDQNWLPQMGSAPEALSMDIKPQASQPSGSNPFGTGQEPSLPSSSPPAGESASGPRWHIVGTGSPYTGGFPSTTGGHTWKFLIEYGDEQVDPEMVVEDPNDPPVDS